MRAALERPGRTPRRAPALARRSRCSATCSSSVPTARAYHVELGEHRHAPASTCWSRSARWPPRSPSRSRARLQLGGRCRRGRRDRARAARTRATWCWSRARSAVGLELVCGPEAARARQRGGRRLMGSVSGRVLIAGTASLLLCLFLSPKFIEFLRRREFGQNIREEGPEGHKTKAGTPTMGGIIIMVAFAIPFLILSHSRLALDRRVRGDRRLRAARLRRRLHEDRQAPLARAARADQAVVTIAISLGLWWVATQKAGIASIDRSQLRRRQRRPRPAVPGVHLPRGRRDDERREPHRRARRPGRRLRGDRAARLHRDHLHRPATTT